MVDDRQRWDERYRGRDPGAPTAPEGLDGLEASVPDGGRALDVACGLGEQTLWMAQRGLDVDALDVSPVAIAALERRAVAAGLADRVRARCVDLAPGLPGDVAGPYDLVVCQRYRDPRLYDALVDLLAPGGLAVVTVLSSVGASGAPGPFHAPPGELDEQLGGRDDVEVLRSVEAAGQATIVIRRAVP